MSFIQVNGRTVAYSLKGHGPLTVLFETGFGAESSEWERVISYVTEPACFFTYDRAGRGESEAPAVTRDTSMLNIELNALLESVGVKPPFVLVGHSFGGMLARLFAQRRPGDVCELLLVESMHSRQFATIGPELPRPSDGEPAELTKLRAFWTEGWKNPSATPESIDLTRSLAIDAGVTDLAMPLHVMSAASFEHMAFLRSADAKHHLQTIWNGLQTNLLSISSKTEQTYLANSGHFVQRDAPEAIADVVSRMLRSVSQQ